MLCAAKCKSGKPCTLPHICEHHSCPELRGCVTVHYRPSRSYQPSCGKQCPWACSALPSLCASSPWCVPRPARGLKAISGVGLVLRAKLRQLHVTTMMQYLSWPYFAFAGCAPQPYSLYFSQPAALGASSTLAVHACVSLLVHRQMADLWCRALLLGCIQHMPWKSGR